MTAPPIGISGTEFRGEHIDVLLETADSVRAQGVELWHPENFTAAGAADTVDRVNRWSGQVFAVSCGVEVAETADVPHTVSRLLEAVDVAGEVGAPRVNTYFGAPGYRDDRRSAEDFLRHLAPVLARAEQAGVTIVLENEFNAFARDHVRGDLTRRPAALLRLLREADNPHLKLNFDAANFYCAGVEPFPYAYGLLAPHVDYLHVKDIRVVDPAAADAGDGLWRRFGDYGDLYATAPLGDGAVNWPGLLRRLAADGYTGPLTLEPHSVDSHRGAAFAQAADWLRRTIADIEEYGSTAHVQ
ncbi:sugar phosphate isomerase/epimerase family protein [Catellatospora sp. NPDC049609]|uniref:sugar phosphate isomerase/epimerase family protein n=1 Tax=Catellatospora sp. NPDC049609 TaxID=3155505 RepID=UPI003430F631